MNRRLALVLGILLVVAGGIVLATRGISYTKRETLVDVGVVKVTHDAEKSIPVSPIVGGVALAAGVGLIVLGVRR